MLLAALSFGAAVIHLAAAPGHFVELGDLGAGFVVAAVFQGAWAKRALADRSARWAWLGIAGNVAIIVAWIWTRTVGLPFGPEAGLPELVGLPDGASTGFELFIVVGLVARLGGIEASILRRLATVPRSLMTATLAPALGLILLTTSVATVQIAAGHDHGHAAGSPAGADASNASESHHP